MYALLLQRDLDWSASSFTPLFMNSDVIGPAIRDPHASPARRDSLTHDDAPSSMFVV